MNDGNKVRLIQLGQFSLFSSWNGSYSQVDPVWEKVENKQQMFQTLAKTNSFVMPVESIRGLF